jgi:hypothetical protein
LIRFVAKAGKNHIRQAASLTQVVGARPDNLLYRWCV